MKNLKIHRDGTVTVNGEPRKPTRTQAGYVINYRGRTLTVGRLVAMRYVPNPNAYAHIEYIDGNPHNPSADNIRWTPYAVRRCVISRAQRDAIRNSTDRGVDLAKRYGVSSALVSRIRGGTR